MYNSLQEDLGDTFRRQVTQRVVTDSHKTFFEVDEKNIYIYVGFDQMMEFFCFILKFATDQFSIESFSLLFRISNLTHALKVVVIPGFQELLTIMLLLWETKVLTT